MGGRVIDESLLLPSRAILLFDVYTKGADDCNVQRRVTWDSSKDKGRIGFRGWCSEDGLGESQQRHRHGSHDLHDERMRR